MRLDHLTTSGVEAGESPERARLMALISLGTLVGLQQLERPPSVESMRQVFAELRSWVRADTGA
jgi:hypothetical protein